MEETAPSNVPSHVPLEAIRELLARDSSLHFKSHLLIPGSAEKAWESASARAQDDEDSAGASASEPCSNQVPFSYGSDVSSSRQTSTVVVPSSPADASSSVFKYLSEGSAPPDPPHAKHSLPTPLPAVLHTFPAVASKLSALGYDFSLVSSVAALRYCRLPPPSAPPPDASPSASVPLLQFVQQLALYRSDWGGGGEEGSTPPDDEKPPPPPSWLVLLGDVDLLHVPTSGSEGAPRRRLSAVFELLPSSSSGYVYFSPAPSSSGRSCDVTMSLEMSVSADDCSSSDLSSILSTFLAEALAEAVPRKNEDPRLQAPGGGTGTLNPSSLAVVVPHPNAAGRKTEGKRVQGGGCGCVVA